MKKFKIIPIITDRSDASLKIFLREASKYPLLDINQEIELSKKALSGDINAANKLVESNLRFVVSVAKQYQNNGLPLVDLIQEGLQGLIKASRLYDESKGFRFISYAVWWIRQAIIHALSEHCRTVRVPMNQIAANTKINKIIEKFEQENCRKPSYEEIEDLTNYSQEKILSAIYTTNRSISFDSPLKEDNDNSLLDITPDESLTDTITQDGVNYEIEKVLSKISNRESDIIRMTYGIGINPMKNEEIANRFGIGCERVRQIQHEALTKIKENYSESLKGLL